MYNTDDQILQIMVKGEMKRPIIIILNKTKQK